MSSILNSTLGTHAPRPLAGDASALLARARQLAARAMPGMQLPEDYRPSLKVCLTCIVKNDAGDDESPTILRLLDSVRGLADCAALTLTARAGHSAVVELAVEEWAQKNRFEVAFQKIVWHDDFAVARNASLAFARESFPRASWLLLLDADEELRANGQEAALRGVLEQGAADAYAVPLTLMGSTVTRVNLVRAGLEWAYEKRHHEVLKLAGGLFSYPILGSVSSPTSGPHVFTTSDGARGRDPRKHEREVKILQECWEDTQDPYYLYYLGAAHMLSGNREEMLKAFGKYLATDMDPNMVGFHYCATLYMARATDSAALYGVAFRICPDRPEASGELALYHARRKEWADCFLWAQCSAFAPPPQHNEWVEPAWSQWRSLDLLTVAIIGLGWWAQADKMLRMLLARPALPFNERPRVEKHLADMQALMAGRMP